MHVHDLTPAPGARRSKRRVARASAARAVRPPAVAPRARRPQHGAPRLRSRFGSPAMVQARNRV